VNDIRRILCPVDRSEPAAHALVVASALAERHGAALTVLEVVDVPAPLLAGPGADGPGLAGAFIDEVRAGLEHLVQPIRDRGIDAEARVVTGPVVREIQRVGDELPADLLVVGTHGRTGVERFLLGSVAERLIRHAHVPTLTVPPGASLTRFARVLCATDFSDPADRAFRQALRLLRPGEGELLLVHVVEWPLGPVSDGDDAVSRLYHSIIGDARTKIDAMAAEATAAGVRCETVVETGRPKHVLVDLARDRIVDAIVLGVTGLNAAQSMLVGSTTGHVVRTAPCGVLVVPAS
jgi:nucleotide-binding universal stress UspA family protein